ncbi:MAG: DUF1540 domain-containing protein [Ruminococcus sp.]|uniref:DUF1540 domain-containing protein n=1 Tax=Ruminococcus sp. TaxID=41978 RepID=UPI00287344E2|nr:DUF1540 domain-containing protein [Ruminococcus sp.]MBQ3284320.1 DUF1540 domain-containing protein [Ruminococcus sp.]
MFNETNANHSIHCSVKGCEFHCGDENFCSLDAIQVASHEKHPTDEKCVDCRSFACKSGKC